MKKAWFVEKARLLKLAATGIALASGVSAAAPAWAHHSYAMFDLTKEVDIKGVVKEFHWTNPHSWILLTTRDTAGTTADVTIEANGPGYLVRQGWKRESLKPGDTITVSMNPLRDGSVGGSLAKVTLSDGTVLSAKVVPDKPDASGDKK